MSKYPSPIHDQSGSPHARVCVDGIPLEDLVKQHGPFLTSYLHSGPDTKVRLESAIAERPEIDPAVSEVARSICPDGIDEGAVCIVAGPTGPGTIFRMVDPIKMDVLRYGSVPSLGSLVESSRLLPSHAIAFADHNGFSMATFGSATVPSSQISSTNTYQSAAELLSALSFLNPAQVVVAGGGDRAEELLEVLVNDLTSSVVSQMPSNAFAMQTDAIADSLVIDAASLRAELITLELGRFRAAREEGAAVEELDVLDALRSGLASSVLVHDDPTDNRLVGSDRLVDLITATALLNGVPLTITPSVPRERGPRGGVGAILAGNALDRKIDRSIVEAVSAATTNAERMPPLAHRSKGA